MKYVYKGKDGSFLGPFNSLPDSFENVSNFPYASTKTIVEHRWYNLVETTEPEYDETTENVIFSYALDDTNGTATKTWEVQGRDDEQLKEFYMKLADSRLSAINDINELAALAHSKYSTNNTGQQAVYAEKIEEATDYIAAGNPTDLSSFPFILADVNVYQNTPLEVVNNIIDARARWILHAAQIETERLRSNKLAQDSTTLTEVAEIVVTAALNFEKIE